MRHGVILAAFLMMTPALARELAFTAQDTVTAFEMDPGDVVRFRLRNGQVRTMVLGETSARVLETNLREPRKAQRDGGTLYEIRAKVRIDGHAVTLLRYVGSQESFAEPYVINGMRLWLDAVSDALQLMSDNHGGTAGCAMARRARFAVNDAKDALAPVELRPWTPFQRLSLDIAECYNGDDPYMGAYQGAECHAGLDINQPKGTPLFAPIDIDDHQCFNSLANGDNNNRWRGIHRWPNGDTWTLQSHHLVGLVVPEHTPIPAGTHYASTAGVFVGSHEHTHFIFRTRRPGEEDLMLDPWMLFWQIFEQEKTRTGGIRAVIGPFGPARTGLAVRFSSEGTRAGRWAFRANYQWTFGDGGFSLDRNPTHIFARPGAYPVTLTVEDGVERASATHVITVDGDPVREPALALSSSDDVSFVERRPEARDTYGVAPAFDPHLLRFTARFGSPSSTFKRVVLKNQGGGELRAARTPSIRYEGPGGWLEVDPEPDGRTLRVRASSGKLTPGPYSATVLIDCPGALNSPQPFRVVLDVRQNRPPAEVVVDDADQGFFATPYFWAGHRFHLWLRKGYKDFYRTSGGRADEGEFARFTPNLREGRYQVSFVDETPFELQPGARFRVAVKHRNGREDFWVEPDKTRRIGEFEFGEGTEGYVELRTEGATGHVLADAIRFTPVTR